MQIEIAEGIRSVLIVEDEALVAMMMEDLVRELGVQDVHICSDVDSALQLATTADIDCAVLDLMVRGGTSESVADALAERGVPFVFTTGSDVGAFGDRHAARPSIGKPFTDDDFKLVLLDTWALRAPPLGTAPPFLTA
jgi:CheY-like chemotaxis protein